MALITKIIVSAALLLSVSASSLEVVCVQGNSTILYSVNDHQNTACLIVSLASAQNKWGGGKSGCNAGTFEEYWSFSNDRRTWLCYGSTSKCIPILAAENPGFANTYGFDKCWSVAL